MFVVLGYAQTSDNTPKARSIKTNKQTNNKKINWTSSKLKISALRKIPLKKKGQVTDWEKMFAKHTSDKGLISKIYKELLQLNNKKTNIPTETQAKGLNRWKISIWNDAQYQSLGKSKL